jgi:hypothetical protein
MDLNGKGILLAYSDDISCPKMPQRKTTLNSKTRIANLLMN